MLIVQKYGGTSVSNIERIKAVAERVSNTVKAGNKVVVVVSAMAGETDKLIGLAIRYALTLQKGKWIYFFHLEKGLLLLLLQWLYINWVIKQLH